MMTEPELAAPAAAQAEDVPQDTEVRLETELGIEADSHVAPPSALQRMVGPVPITTQVDGAPHAAPL
jgi:hypothetical protein